jgi:pyrimidine operon attenuation protein/uracil phosphoribosyltransferase
MQNAVEIMTGDDIARVSKRICHEIIENNLDLDNTVLIGIPTRGTFLANRLGKILSDIGSPIPVGTLDISIFRDDIELRAPREIQPTLIPGGSIAGKNIILVDDVLFSGRTIRASLDALQPHGRPKKVQLAVLVDRGHRELPIRADYVGKNIPTAFSERVQVNLTEIDGSDSVMLYKKIGVNNDE